MSDVRPSPFPAAAVLGGSAILLAQAFQTWPSVVDDAYISARYAAHLADGHGLVYSAGEPPVEGYSNPLWTILLAALLWLRVPVLAAMTGMGFVFALLALPMSVALTRRVAGTDHPLTALPALLIGASTHLAVASTNGIESSQMLFLVLAALWAHLALQEHRARAGLVSGLLAWTRPEAVAVTLAVAAHDLWEHRAAPRRATAAWVGLGVAALQFVLRLAYYGALLPNTYAAKSSFPITETFEVNAQYLTPERYVLGGALGLLVLGAVLPPWNLKKALVTAVAAGLGFVPLTVNLWMPGLRLFLPAMALAIVLVAAGLARLPRLAGRVGAVVLAALVAFVAFNDTRRVQAYDGRHTVQPGNGAQVAAEHLARHLPEGSVLATRDAGVLAYFVGTDVKVSELHQRALTQPHPEGKDHDARSATPDNPEAFIGTVQRDHATELAYGNDKKIFNRLSEPYVYLGRVEQHYHRYYDVYVRADLGVPELPARVVVNHNGPQPKVTGKAADAPAGALPDTGR